MTTKRKIGLIFDIDGCLTLPNYKKSILDNILMDKIFCLYQKGVPITFVTGRSIDWLERQYNALNKMKYFKIPTYIESGLAYLDNEKVIINKEGRPFLKLRKKLLDLLDECSKVDNIYFEKDKMYDDYPIHGSMWFEKKYVQLSIASNTNISTDIVHTITSKAWINYRDKVRILNHHLGVDVIPLNWSKLKAIKHFTAKLNESEYEWLVFGDNESDKEMIKGFSSVSFIDTQLNASNEVSKTLKLVKLIT